jgi:hypothetical protein
LLEELDREVTSKIVSPYLLADDGLRHPVKLRPKVGHSRLYGRRALGVEYPLGAEHTAGPAGSVLGEVQEVGVEIVRHEYESLIASFSPEEELAFFKVLKFDAERLVYPTSGIVHHEANHALPLVELAQDLKNLVIRGQVMRDWLRVPRALEVTGYIGLAGEGYKTLERVVDGRVPMGFNEVHHTLGREVGLLPPYYCNNTAVGLDALGSQRRGPEGGDPCLDELGSSL